MPTVGPSPSELAQHLNLRLQPQRFGKYLKFRGCSCSKRPLLWNLISLNTRLSSHSLASQKDLPKKQRKFTRLYLSLSIHNTHKIMTLRRTTFRAFPLPLYNVPSEQCQSTRPKKGPQSWLAAITGPGTMSGLGRPWKRASRQGPTGRS